MEPERDPDDHDPELEPDGSDDSLDVSPAEDESDVLPEAVGEAPPADVGAGDGATAPAQEIQLDATLAQEIAAARAAAQEARQDRAIQLPLPDEASTQATTIAEPFGAEPIDELRPPTHAPQTESAASGFSTAGKGGQSHFARRNTQNWDSPRNVETCPTESVEQAGRTETLLLPTADGGPPLARPIVVVRVPDEQTRKVVNEIMEAAAERDAKMIAEVADAQERAIMGDF